MTLSPFDLFLTFAFMLVLLPVHQEQPISVISLLTYCPKNPEFTSSNMDKDIFGANLSSSSILGCAETDVI